MGTHPAGQINPHEDRKPIKGDSGEHLATVAVRRQPTDKVTFGRIPAQAYREAFAFI